MYLPLLIAVSIFLLLPTVAAASEYWLAYKNDWFKLSATYPQKKTAEINKTLYLRLLYFPFRTYSGTTYVDQHGITFKRHFKFIALSIPRKIFIPWEDLLTSKSAHYGSLGRLYQLHLSLTPKIELYIDEQLAMELRDASNGRWDYKQSPPETAPIHQYTNNPTTNFKESQL